MSISNELALGLSAWGTARADLSAAAALRKQLPAWAPAGTPGHFLKHADEQTLVAVAAVDRAIREQRLDVSGLRDWSVVAAPRFMGRFAGVTALERFSRGGGPALSPHLIPQHSLHSVSGALSILLASHRPNLGVGGGVDSLAEGLLAALSLPRTNDAAGIWLVATAWDPEPVVDRQGNAVNAPVCYAAALALQKSAAANAGGRLRIETESSLLPTGSDESPLTVPELCQRLDTFDHPGGSLRWRVPGGAVLVLDLPSSQSQRAAA